MFDEDLADLIKVGFKSDVQTITKSLGELFAIDPNLESRLSSECLGRVKKWGTHRQCAEDLAQALKDRCEPEKLKSLSSDSSADLLQEAIHLVREFIAEMKAARQTAQEIATLIQGNSQIRTQTISVSTGNAPDETSTQWWGKVEFVFASNASMTMNYGSFDCD